MKLLKKALIFTMMTAVIFSTFVLPVTAFSKPASLAINGKDVKSTVAAGTPYIDLANRLQVPISVVSKELGSSISWDKKSQTATINKEIKIKVGAKEIATPYGKIKMDTSAVLKAGRIYVPIKYISEALGYQVLYKDRAANIITKTELTISAAASLKDAINEVKALYLQEKPQSKITINLASSGTLEQQIQQGAEVDVFISAAVSNMNNLKDKGLLNNGAVKDLLGNRIVLIVPKSSKLSLSSFSDVLEPSIKKIALGEPKSVPVGKYAEDVFTKLNILTKVKDKTVYAKDVKEVLTWVETGNVDAGVVYSTDAKVSSKVRVIVTAPANSHKPIVYPAAVLKASKSSVAAKDFWNFLSSAKAKAVFEKYGFDSL